MVVAGLQNVIFLCTGNSARSILSEAILREKGKGRFEAFSAGSKPSGHVHPQSLKLLQKLGYDTSFARSKSWDEFAGDDAPVLDFIFTVCGNAAGETCPIWPGKPTTAHWGIDDPAAATGSDEEIAAAFMTAYELLDTRISAFLDLPLDALDPPALQSALSAIGTSEH